MIVLCMRKSLAKVTLVLLALTDGNILPWHTLAWGMLDLTLFQMYEAL